MRKGAAILFSLLFYPVLAVYTLAAVAVLTSWMVVGAPFFSHRENMRRFRRMIAIYSLGIVRGLARPVLRTVFESADPDLRTPRLFISNHVSASDAFLMALLPADGVLVVKDWPFRLPVLGFFARLAGYLNIQGLSAEAFEAAAKRLLDEGNSIVAFPEGTRAGAGPMGPFRGGIFRLALATRVPVVPICIAGNERTPARGSLVLEPATARVRCLPAIPPESYRDMTAFQLKNHVRALIQSEVDRMRAAS